jgi:hypothetical protein
MRRISLLALVALGGCFEDVKEKKDVEVQSTSTTVAPAPTAVGGDRLDKAKEPASPPPVKGGAAAPGGGEKLDKPRPFAAVVTPIEGRLSQEDVDRTIERGLPTLRRCSQEEVEVRLNLTISASGSVTEASAPDSRPDDQRLRDCIATNARSLKFPVPEARKPAKLELTLRLPKASG